MNEFIGSEDSHELVLTARTYIYIYAKYLVASTGGMSNEIRKIAGNESRGL